jgi:hypothetical protein
MANSIKWKAIEHSLSQQKNAHVILVAYQSMGKGGMNKVVAVAPLYDLRDMNLDGSASISEIAWLGLTSIFDPYEVFGVINSLGTQSPVHDSAIQLRDFQLKNQVESGILKATHKACARALTTLLVEKVLSPGIELNLANIGLLNMSKNSEFVQFIVQQGLETLIMESICATRN